MFHNFHPGSVYVSVCVTLGRGTIHLHFIHIIQYSEHLGLVNYTFCTHLQKGNLHDTLYRAGEYEHEGRVSYDRYPLPEQRLCYKMGPGLGHHQRQRYCILDLKQTKG